MTQTISNESQGAGSPYFGKRAVLLTRVSTPKQIEMYGHAWQEMQIRKLLVEPLGLLLNEERHIIRDTYSGLEYRYREALDTILTMAERQEFDVLCMDVLDRGLGRKALAREIFRMQLRELGIRILTTEPSDHADDDSLEGLIMRFMRGYKAEEEINDLVRRTLGGKRAKAEGRERDGALGQPKIVGNGSRLYGYQWVLNGNGKPIGLDLNCEIVQVDETGEEWTEVKVVRFIFESSEKGLSIRRIAELLNEKHLPPPTVTKGVQIRRRTGVPPWQPSVVGKILKHPAYWGEYLQFRTLTGEKKPGQKLKPRRMAPADHQIIIPVPAIVSKELAERVQTLLPLRQKKASRNNRNPNESLLRAGLVKCGECGGNMSTSRRLQKGSDYIRYICGKHNLVGRCVGCNIPARMVDEAAWQRALEIIRDPSEADAKIKQLTTSNEKIKRREQTRINLAEVRRKQANLRRELSVLAQEGGLDKGTREFFTGQLAILAKQEEEAKKQHEDERAFQQKYNLLQKRIEQFHKRCADWREKLDDPEFNPSYDFKRDACEFFGITAIVYKFGRNPRFEIQARTPSLMSLISSV
jgi:Recombinase/Resolvase, N terminal domain/Recombinase zinc beta ribbon domain